MKIKREEFAIPDKMDVRTMYVYYQCAVHGFLCHSGPI